MKKIRKTRSYSIEDIVGGRGQRGICLIKNRGKRADLGKLLLMFCINQLNLDQDGEKWNLARCMGWQSILMYEYSFPGSLIMVYAGKSCFWIYFSDFPDGFILDLPLRCHIMATFGKTSDSELLRIIKEASFLKLKS